MRALDSDLMGVERVVDNRGSVAIQWEVSGSASIVARRVVSGLNPIKEFNGYGSCGAVRSKPQNGFLVLTSPATRVDGLKIDIILVCSDL